MMAFIFLLLFNMIFFAPLYKFSFLSLLQVKVCSSVFSIMQKSVQISICTFEIFREFIRISKDSGKDFTTSIQNIPNLIIYVQIRTIILIIQASPGIHLNLLHVFSTYVQLNLVTFLFKNSLSYFGVQSVILDQNNLKIKQNILAE